jgi:hypothetical protein
MPENRTAPVSGVPPRAGQVILLPMEIDPATEWQRLTEIYREKYDGELLELAADAGDLTEVAQRVLAEEMQRRKLSLERPSEPTRAEPHAAGDLDADALVYDGAAEADGPHEFTWKTLLCECNEYEEAWQISAALRRAGIDSWIQGTRSLSYPRVVVAADQLDQARAIIARPIPQDIVDESKTKVPEYEPPVCPTCGADDPVLESADPVNAWECEQCGARWTDAAEEHPEHP